MYRLQKAANQGKLILELSLINRKAHHSKQCDEQRPECGRCIKRGLKCQGWEAFRNFIDGTSIQEAKSTMERRHPTILRTSTSTGQYSKVPALVHSGQITRQKVFGSFIERYTPSETLYSKVCFDNHVLSSIQNLPQKSWVIEVALSAISCVFLGRATKDPGISHHGLTLYNSAIRQVTNMLQRGIYTKELFYITFIFQELNVRTFERTHIFPIFGANWS